MNTTAAEIEPVAIKTCAEKRMTYLELTDGLIVGFPADQFEILSQASESQLKEVQLGLAGSVVRALRSLLSRVILD